MLSRYGYKKGRGVEPHRLTPPSDGVGTPVSLVSGGGLEGVGVFISMWDEEGVFWGHSVRVEVDVKRNTLDLSSSSSSSSVHFFAPRRDGEQTGPCVILDTGRGSHLWGKSLAFLVVILYQILCIKRSK